MRYANLDLITDDTVPLIYRLVRSHLEDMTNNSLSISQYLYLIGHAISRNTLTLSENKDGKKTMQMWQFNTVGVAFTKSLPLCIDVMHSTLIFSFFALKCKNDKKLPIRARNTKY